MGIPKKLMLKSGHDDEYIFFTVLRLIDQRIAFLDCLSFTGGVIILLIQDMVCNSLLYSVIDARLIRLVLLASKKEFTPEIIDPSQNIAIQK